MSMPIIASGLDPTQPRPLRDFRYYELLVNAFVVILLISNLVAQKLVKLGPLTLSGAQLLFPITYIFGDVFTEVYGYAGSRRAIWIGFGASALAHQRCARAPNASHTLPQGAG